MEKQVLLVAERLQLQPQQQQQVIKKRRQATTATLNGLGSSCSNSDCSLRQHSSADAQPFPAAAAAGGGSNGAATGASVGAGLAVLAQGDCLTKKVRQQPLEENKQTSSRSCLRRDATGAAAAPVAAAVAAAAAAPASGCLEAGAEAARMEKKHSLCNGSTSHVGEEEKNRSGGSSDSSSSRRHMQRSSSSSCDVTGGRRSRNSSVLFQAVRNVGKVTEGVPFSSSNLGGKCFICCSVGKSFQVYEGEKLRVVFTSSPPLQHRIRLLLADRATVYVAEKRRIIALRRFESVLSFSFPPAATASLPFVARRCTCRWRPLRSSCNDTFSSGDNSSSDSKGSCSRSSSRNAGSSRNRERESWCEACEELQEEEKLRGMFVMGKWLVAFTSLQLCVWDKQTGRLLRVISPAQVLRRREQTLLQQQQRQQHSVASLKETAAVHTPAAGAIGTPSVGRSAGGASAGDRGTAVAAPPAARVTAVPEWEGGQTAYPGLLLSAALHPDTYLRKALLGFENGVLLIVNLHTGVCVHELRCLYTAGGAGAVARQQAVDRSGGSSSAEGSEDEEEEDKASGAVPAFPSSFSIPDSLAGTAAAAAPFATAAAGSRSCPAVDARPAFSVTGRPSQESYWGGVTCMAASEEPDVVGVGFSTGRVAIVDIRKDDLLLQFSHSAAQGRVCALAFRRDAAAAAADVDAQEAQGGGEEGGGGEETTAAGGRAEGREAATAIAAAAAVLVTGAHNGDLLVWNLDTGAFHGVVPRAHDGPIVALQFFPGQPLLLSSGVDNALVLWIFDQADGMPRELKARRGHVGDVDRMRFYDGEGTELLTSSALRGRGHLGKTSFIQQQQNCEFSAKLLRKKAPEWGLPFKRLPPVVDFAVAPSRHFDWPNVVSVHQNCHAAFVWSYHDRTLAPLLLRVSRYATAAATAVAASACGHYVVVGYEDGSLHRFNLQSGAYRGAYVVHSRHQKEGEKQQQQRELLMAGGTAHVCSLAVLSSAVLLSACAHPQDAAVYTWDLLTRELQQRFELPSDRPHTRGSSSLGSSAPSSSGIQSFCCSGALTAVLMQSGVVFLVDVISRTTLRRIWLEGAPAAAVAFSPDTRWLAVAAAAGSPAGPSLFVYDVLSATVVDWMGFAAPVKALTFDPSGAFLLTSHEHGGGGVCVWANKYAFDPTLAAPVLNRNCAAPIFVEEPPADVQQQPDDEVPQQQQHLQLHRLHTTQAPGGKSEEEGGGTKKDQDMQQQKLVTCVGPYYKTQRRQLFRGLLTLSSVAPAQLQALVCLEELRAKCKPKIRVAESIPDAPFFLPTRADLHGTKFALPSGPALNEQQQEQQQPQGQEAEAAKNRKEAAAAAADHAVAFFLGAASESGVQLQVGKNSSSSGNKRSSSRKARKDDEKKKQMDFRSPLQKLLAATASMEAASADAAEAENGPPQDKQNSSSSNTTDRVSTASSPLVRSSKLYEGILVYLRSLSPSAAALALQDVGLYAGGTNQELVTLLRFFNYHVSRRHHADLVQALLHLFLQAHGDTLAAAAPLSEEARLCRRLHARMARDWRNIESCFERLQCFLKFLTHLETV